MSGRGDRDRTRPALRLIPGTPDPSPGAAGTEVQLLIFAADGTVLAEAYIAELAPLGPDAWDMHAVVSGPRSTFALTPLVPPVPVAGPRLCPPPERGQNPDRTPRPGPPAAPAPAGRPIPSGSTHRRDES